MNSIKLLSIFLFCYLLILLVSCSKKTEYPPLSTDCNSVKTSPVLNRIFFQNQYTYLLGTNYPWKNYGHDFGKTAWGNYGINTHINEITNDFSYFKTKNIKVVRWFLFGDGRANPQIDFQNMTINIDPSFYQDLDQLLSIAGTQNIYLVLVLLDYSICSTAQWINGVQLGGKCSILSNPLMTQLFLENALKPVLQKYGSHPNILAWEIMNEPEGAMQIAGGAWVPESIAPLTMQKFILDTVNFIHLYSNQFVTVGSSSFSTLKGWKGCGLDFYQFHYYNQQQPLPSSDSFGLEKPVIVGEIPTQTSEYQINSTLNLIYNNNYAGVLGWSYKSSDPYSNSDHILYFFNWRTSHSTIIF